MPRIPPRRKAAKPPCNKSPLRPALCLLTSRHGSFFRHQALQADTCIQEGIPGMNHSKEDIKRQIIKLDVDPSLRTEVRKIMIRDGIRQGVFIPRPPLQDELLVHLPQCCCAGHLYPHQRPLRARPFLLQLGSRRIISSPADRRPEAIVHSRDLSFKVVESFQSGKRGQQLGTCRRPLAITSFFYFS